jgi:hypothetical protein
MQLRVCALAAVLAALIATPAAAQEADLWATVNVCDTPAHPDEIGIRASMPGARKAATLAMRFRVQYRDLEDFRWHYVRAADSGWRRIGRQAGRALESGWSFQVSGRGTRILRGIVYYRWLRGGRIVRRDRRLTEGGHRSTAGADPEDFSAATCRVA